jgi:dolichol kinase
VTEGGAAPLALRHELGRKALHLTTTIVPLAYAGGLPQPVVVVALATLVVIAIVVEVARHGSPRWRQRFERLVGPLLRGPEHAGIAGATWLLGGFLLVAALAPRPAAIAAMWAVAAGDAAASIVGRSVGRIRLGSRKTLEGLVAGFAVTAAGTACLTGLSWPAAILTGAVAAAAELPERPGDDNVRVAIATALVVVLAGGRGP